MKKFFLQMMMKKMPEVFTIRHWLLISSAFSIILLLLRLITSGRISYIFLAWNLFLAYIPFHISTWLSRHTEVMKSRTKLAFLIFIWILFMPNSFYILTDLFHLQNMENGHPWFDLTLILSFAWNGILFGVISIREMEILLKKAKGKLISGLVVCMVMWLNAFGIYIGRFLRFNSWDIIANPFSLLSEISDMVFNPYDYRYAWAMSFCFAFFMIIIYYTIKKLSETFKNG
ncbi:MAG TPA: DUF1361 domain-containing protein [Chitinophagaceae bacterium]|jgi:uncharacterized membrane protein|nr:DUF1361 domain-containing protein [Chitinophagaceae bacterium]